MARSALLTKEDFWVICIGFFFLLFGLAAFFLSAQDDLSTLHRSWNDVINEEEAKIPFRSIEAWQAIDEKEALKVSKEKFPKFISKLTGKPGGWKSNPLEAIWISQAKADKKKKALEDALYAQQFEVGRFLTGAKKLTAVARLAKFEDPIRNESAIGAIEMWRTEKEKFDAIDKKYRAKSFSKIPYLVGLFFVFAILFGFGVKIMGGSFMRFAKGFAIVFLIGIISYWIEGQASAKALGLSYAAWAIVIGLLISNTIGTPKWVLPAAKTEFFIKTGLILLGAEILMSKILAIGLPGIFVAWFVTPIVLVSTYWFGQKVLKISSKTLNMTISADMSVCGVSAAVATAAACKASKEELTLAIGLSMIFTSVMMVVLPAFINLVGMPEVLGGAWIGGTIDATGAVVAAGAFLGEKALTVAATIKMIQNVLIGLIAFGVAIYFTSKVDRQEGQKIGLNEIWRRFPKFVLGFIGASILFSLIYIGIGDDMAYSVIDQGVIRGFTKNLRGWMFCLAFVSIGLSTDFKAFRPYLKGGKPLILYACGQTFNLCLTLLMAYIMFYLVFPNITNAI